MGHLFNSRSLTGCISVFRQISAGLFSSPLWTVISPLRRRVRRDFYGFSLCSPRLCGEIISVIAWNWTALSRFRVRFGVKPKRGKNRPSLAKLLRCVSFDLEGVGRTFSLPGRLESLPHICFPLAPLCGQSVSKMIWCKIISSLCPLWLFFEPRLEAKRKDNFYLEIGEAGSWTLIDVARQSRKRI